MTGDEPGSCRSITGDEYIGLEQYQAFCEAIPQPEAPKVELSRTAKGQRVTGTQTGRGAVVTGNEPGTCKAITGTPYAGLEQYQRYCDVNAQGLAQVRARQLAMTPGPNLTGQQPGLNGRLTGAERGACASITGTPYVGRDQYAEACPAQAAGPGSADYPQALVGSPWNSFSISSPAREAQRSRKRLGVTGTVYEHGQITGPFGMAEGKVTGTEQFRFGAEESEASLPAVSEPSPDEVAQPAQDRLKSRVTGEGMDGGLRITGDDWERGERVTGTEGTSAARRNPTRRGGPMSALPTVLPFKRNESVAEPVARVTGSSGSTEKGALVTLSGGARG